MPMILKSLLFAALFTFGTSLAAAQSSDPDWLDALRIQLATDEQCEVNYFLNLHEGQLGANKYYEARVQCLDGRMFDASRTQPEAEFTIRPCGVAVC